jgi:hypothetical protein
MADGYRRTVVNRMDSYSRLFLGVAGVSFLLFYFFSVTCSWKRSEKRVTEGIFQIKLNVKHATSRRIRRIREWTEEGWRGYLTLGYQNPLEKGEKIEIQVKGSFLLSNFTEIGEDHLCIYLSETTGRNTQDTGREKTQIAHELFHLFQARLFWPEDDIRAELGWLFEGTALYEAGKVMNSLKVLEDFPYREDQSLFRNDYGAAWFWLFIETEYGGNTVRKVWENLSAERPRTSPDIIASVKKTILICTNTSFDRILEDFLRNMKPVEEALPAR